MPKRNWLVILNPRAGRGRAARLRPQLERLLHELAPPGVTWRMSETKARGDATILAAAAASQGFDGVAAAGGDGTLNEVLNGVLATGVASTTLAVLPLGTGNDFARCLGVAGPLRTSVQTLFQGRERAVDVGQASVNNSQRYFLNVAGCGFDAAVAQRVNQGYRSLRGTPAYIAAVVQTLRRHHPTPVRISADGQTFEQTALLCAVANATTYGGGMRIAPKATLDDGCFDVCIIGDATPFEFALAFPRVFTGRHIAHPKVKMLRASNVEVSFLPALPVLLDGEVVGTTPATFRTVAGAVRVNAPAIAGNY